jgi:hypothetical protein
MAAPLPRHPGCVRRAGLAALLLLAACNSWRVQPITPVELVSGRHPAQVRLRGHDGRQLVVRRPFVRGDSVLGVARRDTTGLPVTEIRTVAIRRFDWLKTTGLIVLTSGATLGLACAMACGFGTVGFAP